MERRSLEDEVGELVAACVDKRQRPYLGGELFDAADMIRGTHAARVEVPGWRLQLSSIECSRTVHWHLVGRPTDDEDDFDRIVDRVFARSSGRGIIETVSRSDALVKHVSWHSSELAVECRLLVKLREALYAQGRRR
jgi:hypothetical protein